MSKCRGVGPSAHNVEKYRDRLGPSGLVEKGDSNEHLPGIGRDVF